ncbi:MAG: hypothetical protein L3K08_06500, partial [Thermoplasmata archaeon]|nr:hypothetical protein [Thermoplasmata archaeon]
MNISPCSQGIGRNPSVNDSVNASIDGRICTVRPSITTSREFVRSPSRTRRLGNCSRRRTIRGACAWYAFWSSSRTGVTTTRFPAHGRA